MKISGGHLTEITNRKSVPRGRLVFNILVTSNINLKMCIMNLKKFELSGRMIGFDNIVVAIAKVCHEANRTYCKIIGDDSQLPWEESPNWQKESAVTGVIFHMNNPESKPSDSHESWLLEKANAGWKYGKVKNAETKEHPCFVPFELLPIEQQKKDHLFLAIVRALE